ncbi:MAG: sigma-54-dependent Fis family transcriptional regulator [Deltaproteobacteria bacterium RBG_19FT_COMBO_46_12]|nr:MAG: sigma-54-dependent Fis family transcriptional regulator [Deltaproteobacteria bacterium RBG_19FT_COMBO_46_12]
METIVVVDDDLSLCHFLTKPLSQKGYQVIACHNGKQALEIINEQEADLILLDNKLPDRMGLEILKDIKQTRPKMPVIIMTAFGTTDTAIEAMRLGAFDYVLKPFELEEISELVVKGLEANKLMKKAVAIPALSEFMEDSDQIIGKSKAMQEVYKLIGQVAESDVTVLIRGESGTGKELVARAIYQHSHRKDAPFLAINCAAIPETLLESELFGHEKGAFTGASKKRIGKFEQCNQGTILLDEVGDMTLATQAKILRVLQEGEFERIGGNETIRADVRVLASTNRRLEELINQGKFREDLYYRLKIMSITLPPLKERKEDIQELTEYFFHLYNRQLGTQVRYIDPSIFNKLFSYSWSGNVRELANTIKRGLILAKGDVLTAEDIIFDTEDSAISFANEEELEKNLNKMLDPLFSDILRFWGTGLHSNLLEKVEKFLIQKSLAETSGNQVQAAKLLGISRNTLRHRIEKYGLLS